MSRNLKDKYDNVNPRRTHTIMSAEDAASGRKSYWAELEITGNNNEFYKLAVSTTAIKKLFLIKSHMQQSTKIWSVLL